MRRAMVISLLVLLAACRGTNDGFETRTFQLHRLSQAQALEIVRPYVYGGALSAAGNLLTVRESHDNLQRITLLLAERDQDPGNIRLQFQIIRADGAAPPDSAIAQVESQLRRLFRFRGYRLIAQATTVSSGNSNFRVRTSGDHEEFDIEGGLEDIIVSGDSGSARLAVNLSASRFGPILNTRMNIRLGHTAVIGGQPVGADALVLAVRAEPDVSP